MEKAERRVGKCIPRRAGEGSCSKRGSGGGSLLYCRTRGCAWFPVGCAWFPLPFLHTLCIRAHGDFQGWRQTGAAQPGSCGDALLPDGPVSLAGSFPAHLFLIPDRQHTHCFCDSSVVNSRLQPLGDQGGKPQSQNRSWHKQERLAGGGKEPFLCLPFPRAMRHSLAWALLPSKPLPPPLNSSGAPGLCMCGCGQSLLRRPGRGGSIAVPVSQGKGAGE